MADRDSFVALLEEMEQELLDWATQYEDTMVEALSPGGRPFGMVRKPMDELLEDYKAIRGNPAAWSRFIDERLVAALQEAGDAPLDEVKRRHLYDIVVRWVVQYSVMMERELRRRDAGEAAG